MVGTMIPAKMITPPIVGVPAFTICPSKPKSLIDSPTCFLCKNLISLPPKTRVITSEVITAIPALNEINSNNPEPGKSKF